jgi:signal transduction histidine kinase
MSFDADLARPATLPTSQRATAPAPLQSLRGWPHWLVPIAMVAGLTAYVNLLITSPSDPITQRQVVSEAGQIISLIVAVSLCVWASARAPRGRARWAWRCFALAFTTYAAAEAVFGYEGIVIFAGQSTPTPTLADALYLPFYPLMVTGLVLLPSASLSGSSRARILVDAGITAGALLGLGLIYLITPYFQGDTPPLTQAVLVAYPVGDTILLLSLIFLLTRGVQVSYRPIVFWLALGLLSFIFADASFDYAGLQNTYVVGTISIDPFWAVGELIMSLAPLHFLIYGDQTPRMWSWLQRLGPRRTANALAASLRRVILPYLSVLTLLALLYLNQPALPSGSSYLVLELLTLVVVILIIARQILLGRDLVDAQVASQRAQQLDDLKNQFISSVNHELRTPLMTMQAYIELLRARHEQIATPRRGVLIEEVGRTSDALVDLVQSILEVRRLDQETGDFPREAVAIQDALEKAIVLVNPREAEVQERALRVQIPHGLAIWGEPVRLQQILTNLLTNAVKYSPPGTDVEVSAQLTSSKKRARRLGEGGPQVEIVVRDYGFGIPPNEAPLLFNRFVRLPRDLASKVVGSGLGLYLCRTLTEAMGGRIWVESTGIPGEGSAFHVVLPAAPAGGDTPPHSSDGHRRDEVQSNKLSR